MASETKNENIMLTGQTAYFKKNGSMVNRGTLNLANALSARSYAEGYIGPNSVLHGTDLALTSEYKTCANSMKSYLGEHWTEKEGERSIITNSNVIKNLLAEGCNDMQLIANSTIKPYIELAYIRSTGTQYIDTGITPTNHYVEIKCRISSSSAGQVLFGTDATGFGVSLMNSSKWKYATGTEEKVETGTHPYSQVGIFTYNKDHKFMINDDVIDDNIHAYNGTDNIYLCSRPNLGDGVNGYVYVYYFKIYECGTNKLVRDFIPVKDKDSILCFYEKITGAYYYSDGTAQFTSSGTKASYKYNLEYIETINDSYALGYGSSVTGSVSGNGFELDFMPMEDFSAVDGAEKYILCASNGSDPDTNYYVRICSYPGYPNGMIQINPTGEMMDAKLQFGKRQKISCKNGVLTLPDGSTHNIKLGTATNTSLNWRIGQSRVANEIDHARVRLYNFKLYNSYNYVVSNALPKLSNTNIAWLLNDMTQTSINKSGVLKPGPIKKGE